MCVGVYAIAVTNLFLTTECLEHRLNQHSCASNSKGVDIYDSGEQCNIETVDNIKRRVDPFEMLPSNNMKDRKMMIELETADNRKKWVDPFNMLPLNNVKNTKPNPDPSEKQEKQCEAYMQRFINLFLRRSGLTVSKK